MINTMALFWGLFIVCIINMARYYTSVRTLLAVMRSCDPLLYQYVDGPGFFTTHGQPSKQLRLIRYILLQRYVEHHDDEFIQRCQRVRNLFVLSSLLNGLLFVCLIAIIIWG